MRHERYRHNRLIYGGYNMEKIYFKCKLLTDIIISEKSATDGHKHTLDFIPGANFLGICARQYDKLSKEEQLMMFHTGDVQFGDAHVMHNGIRTLRIPSSMFYPKGKKIEDYCFIHHGLNPENCPQINGKDIQLKQSRKGFYAFDAVDKTIQKKDILTAYAIKSAYDYDKRRSEDEQMYGYESIDAGYEFLFEVRLSDKAEKLSKIITDYLEGTHSIGKSKTAQYGLVEITKTDDIKAFPDYSSEKSKDFNNESIQVVYAESRLIFFDEKKMQPTFQPTAKQLGFEENAEIAWELSQIRTFQYTPWNNKRQTFDADRCGIEKGSVIVVKHATIPPKEDVIGSFKSEGFGKVIFNPSFLEFKEGLSTWSFGPKEQKDTKDSKNITSVEVPLLRFLKEKKESAEANIGIMNIVNEFVRNNKHLFMDEDFKSQWGSIRDIAVQFDGEKLKEKLKDYINSGVAKDKWIQSGGKIVFEAFINNYTQKNLNKVIINLASEMMKAIKK